MYEGFSGFFGLVIRVRGLLQWFRVSPTEWVGSGVLLVYRLEFDLGRNRYGPYPRLLRDTGTRRSALYLDPVLFRSRGTCPVGLLTLVLGLRRSIRQ